MTRRMTLSVSKRQQWGSTGTLQVHAEMHLKCLLLHVDRHMEPDLFHCCWWEMGWRCASCCTCAQRCIGLETSYRGLCGWGVRIKEGKRNRYGMRSRKSKMLKVREEEKVRWEPWLQFFFSDHMGHLELGIPFPAFNPKCLCLCKYHSWGNSIFFSKDIVICISR